MPDLNDIKLMRRARERLDLVPLVIHDNYLINLAACDAGVRQLSIQAFRGELERAAAIGAEYLVAHPGSYKGQTLEQGMALFVEGLAEAARGLDFGGVTLLLECTAGSGNAIGSRFEELAAIREVAANMTDLPIGYCLDTCHLLASGYDVSTEAGLKLTVKLAGSILGFDNIKLIHANDSKTALGSRRDRHENIGEGFVGIGGFRRILTHPKLKKLPFILETPVDKEGDDRRNLEMLKKLAGD